MDIIAMAFSLADAVAAFAGRAKLLYYAVMLLGHSCLRCGGRLTMVAEGLCRKRKGSEKKERGQKRKKGVRA